MNKIGTDHTTDEPLHDLDDWESVHLGDAAETAVEHDGQTFRDYRTNVRAGVRDFYRVNHEKQTLDFVLAKKRQFLPRERCKMTAWDALEYLNTLVDDSDPDTELSQIEHAMQSAEAARGDGRPDWFIATCLIHDLGKVLCLFGEPQWAVVGDTFPVGCQFSDKVVFPEFFLHNPDYHDHKYQTACGIYQEHGGLEHVHLSWGHDEYLYQVVRDHLPDEALAMIRYHSFYAGHQQRAYGHLMHERDLALMDWVREFNPYDLYSKGREKPDAAALTPYYRDLLDRFFPTPLRW